MKKKFIIFGIVLSGIILIISITTYIRNRLEKGAISASGNVEITEVNLGFKSAGRIAELFAEEGQNVNKGDKLARLDNAESAAIVLQNKALLNEAMVRLEELKAGARPQEIEQAKLNMESAEAALSESKARLEELKAGARPQEIEQAKLNMESAEAGLSEAKAKLDELRTGARPQEIEQAKLNLDSAGSEFEKAKKDYERAEVLYKNGAVSLSQFDAVKNVYDTRAAQYKNAKEKFSLIKEGARQEEIKAYEQRFEQAKKALENAREKYSLVKEGARKETIEAAEHRVEQARKSFENAKEKYSLVKEGARKEEVRAAQYRVEQAKAVLSVSEERLKDTILYTPITGVILKKYVEVGETAGSGGSVYTVGDLMNANVKIYVKETKLGLVKLGQKAKVTTDSYPGKEYEGVVTNISSEAEFTPKNIQTKEERIKLVFGVKVSVKNIDNELKPGMPADVKIILDK
ncbi:MAG: efflux RND transporter periplasmic adaptor subunit [bacterium]